MEPPPNLTQPRYGASAADRALRSVTRVDHATSDRADVRACDQGSCGMAIGRTRAVCPGSNISSSISRYQPGQSSLGAAERSDPTIQRLCIVDVIPAVLVAPHRFQWRATSDGVRSLRLAASTFGHRVHPSPSK